MSAMDGMPMPGGWTMSMVWMRMPDQTWIGFGGSFLGVWVVMMVAMMLPSLARTLWRCRQGVGGATAVVAAAYFSVWALFGVAAFLLGAALTAVQMGQPALARAAPIAAGVVLIVAGALQFSPWKARHLARCREPSGGGGAWRHGLRLGLECSRCCAGLMAILLVVGVMDLRAMALVGAAITVERVAPGGERVARAIGVGVVGTGLLLISRAVGLTP
jgi:predicted metal-binding membrane protein